MDNAANDADRVQAASKDRARAVVNAYRTTSDREYPDILPVGNERMNVSNCGPSRSLVVDDDDSSASSDSEDYVLFRNEEHFTLDDVNTNATNVVEQSNSHWNTAQVGINEGTRSHAVASGVERVRGNCDSAVVTGPVQRIDIRDFSRDNYQTNDPKNPFEYQVDFDTLGAVSSTRAMHRRVQGRGIAQAKEPGEAALPPGAQRGTSTSPALRRRKRGADSMLPDNIASGSGTKKRMRSAQHATTGTGMIAQVPRVREQFVSEQSSAGQHQPLDAHTDRAASAARVSRSYDPDDHDEPLF